MRRQLTVCDCGSKIALVIVLGSKGVSKDHNIEYCLVNQEVSVNQEVMSNVAHGCTKDDW